MPTRSSSGPSRASSRRVSPHAIRRVPGTETLARKGRILDAYCAAIGRDPKVITRSANMPPAITEDPAEIERLKTVFMRDVAPAFR